MITQKRFNGLAILLGLMVTSLSVNAQLLDITKFGAVPDGKTLNTVAIQKVIDQAAVTGGTVYVPTGIFYTGTLFLKDRVTLHLAGGAVLLGSTNIKDYTQMTWGHHEDRTPWHLIVAKNVNDVRITGQGTIDGNGKAFWKPNRRHDWDFYKEIEERPSPMVEIDGCKHVTVEGVTIQNSAGWGLHPFNSYDVKLMGLTILNSAFGPNSDGIDVGGCSHLIISDCNIDVGDDAIALKTTEDSGPCEYVTISNCILSTSCVALRIGYESRQDFRYITVNNLVVKTSSRIIDIRSLEGGTIEHVIINNITGTTNSGWPLNRVIEIEVDTVNTPYDVEIKEHPNYRKPKPVNKLGAIRDVSISNLSIITDGRIMMAAAPKMELDNIRFSNIHLHYAMIDQPDPLAAKARSIGFYKNMPDVRSAKAAFVAQNVSRLQVEGVTITWPRFPVSADWNLLKTEWRFLNPEFYRGNESDIRSGKKRASFGVFWGKGLTDQALKLEGAKSSDASIKPVVILP